MTYKDYKRQIKLASILGCLGDKYKSLNDYMKAITTDLVCYTRDNSDIVYYFKDDECLFNVKDYYLSFSLDITKKVMTEYGMSYNHAEYLIFESLNNSIGGKCTEFYSVVPTINYVNIEKEFMCIK